MNPFAKPPRLVLLALAGLIWIPAAAAKTNYKKWLSQEVTWISSQAEREGFKRLESDAERDAFIEKFWLRRDPTPGTERNEYKEEHYRRHIFATQNFQEGVPGWKTDRGRVYIIHGEPAAQYSFESRNRVSPTREIPHTERSPRTIVWVYHQNPLAEYYKGEIRLVFQPKGGMNRQDFVLSESKTAQDRADQMARHFFPASDANWLEADVRYRLTMAGPPAVINAKGADLPNSGVSEFARYVNDVFRSPGEVLEARERELRRLEESRQELNRTVQARVSFDQLNFTVDPMTFHRHQADWLLPVQLRIASLELSEEKVEVYAALLDSQNNVFDEFIDTLQFDRQLLSEAGLDHLYYSNSFSAPEGEYTLRTVVREVGSRRAGYRETPVRLVAAPPRKLQLGSILLTNRVQTLSGPQQGQATQRQQPLNGVLYNELRLVPSRVDRFFENGYAFLYLQVWLPPGCQQATVNANFIRDGQIVRRLDARRVENPRQGYAEYGTIFALEGFEPGQYTLQIHAIERHSKTYDIRRTSFRIEEAF